MNTAFGKNITVSLFGESHGEYVGALLCGVPSGIKVDCEYIKSRLDIRRGEEASGSARREADEFKIISGVFCGYTSGAPLLILIKNSDVKSENYPECMEIPRPSHADYTAHVKYGGFEDFRGGGHFSGRLTAPLVAAAAILYPILKAKGITVASHIYSCGDIFDTAFSQNVSEAETVANMPFPVIDKNAKEQMRAAVQNAKAQGDSLGGSIETAVFGMPAGVGGPYFERLESIISSAVFSIPAVKGVEFGLGFGFVKANGSISNDPLYFDNGTVRTKTNNCGGINGGISNGEPIVFKTAVKPAPTVAAEQSSVNLISGENVKKAFCGRHDTFIPQKAAAAVSAVTVIALCDILLGLYGEKGIL